MSRNYNFCAGPAAIPEEVLSQLKEEIPDWKGKGLSVMEMSHRSKEFVEIAETAKQDFIDLLKINSDYEVLFIQGGASLQFSMVPMNLLTSDKSLCSYLDVGQWSKKAIKEAKKFGLVEISASSADESYKKYPDPKSWKIDENSLFTHLVLNETIDGVSLRNLENLQLVFTAFFFMLMYHFLTDIVVCRWTIEAAFQNALTFGILQKWRGATAILRTGPLRSN